MLVERFYDFSEICQAADCKQIAVEIGLKINRESRTAATWRGGENESSVSISRSGWHDFGTGESGSVIELVSKVMFNDNIQESQQWLGDKFILSPKMTLEKDRKNRVDILKEKGYKLIKEYPYHDVDRTVKHITQRWEHDNEDTKKEFVQRTPEGRFSIKGIKTVLYNLPLWINSDYVCICEGEKDADTLTEMGFHATCNASGAGRWESYYNDWLKGKGVIIVVDNDKAGETRCNYLLWELREIATKIKVINFKKEKDGFDISDYMAANGHEATRNLILTAPEFDKTSIKKPGEDYPAILAAKEANKKDFENYILFQVEGKDHKKPKQINQLIADCHTRFLGFPCKVGEKLFDQDKESDNIEFIHDHKSFFSWIMQKSNRITKWKGGEGFLSKEEFFAGVHRSAKRFEAISYVPDYPRRSDVYYAHPEMPRPTETREHFEKLMSFFNPSTDADRILMKAFFTAPLFYIPGVQSPAWIIDSHDGAGTGKTTLVESVAHLYNTEPVRTHKGEIQRNFTEIMKRLVSSSGRMKRVLLIDNVQGSFCCPEYADMITAKSLSGRPSYGKGEETRPNNLNYVITANSATVDNDIADRSYYIFVAASKISSSWKSELNNYIEKFRYNIIADIIAYLETNEPFQVEPATRFPEFETRILQAFCGDLSEYDEVKEAIKTARNESNIDEENAAIISEIIKTEITNLVQSVDDCFFIRSEVLKQWFKDCKTSLNIANIQYAIRDYARQGMIPEVDKKTRVYPHHSTPENPRRKGIMWNRKDESNPYYDSEKPKIIGVRNDKKVGVLI